VNTRSLIGLKTFGALAVVLVLGATAATASATRSSTTWALDSLAAPTSFSSDDDAQCETEPHSDPIGCDHYVVVPSNIGGLESNGTITVAGKLPQGVTTATTPYQLKGHHTLTNWQCSEGAGQTEFSCTTEGRVPALTPASEIIVPVYVSAEAQRGSLLVADFTVSGGGAEHATSTTTPTTVDGPPQPFDFLDSSLTASLLDPTGALETTAGSHPSGFRLAFAFPSAMFTNEVGVFRVHPVENVKQIVTDLPVGLIGDALAAPTCSEGAVGSLGFDPNACPIASRVGDLVLFTPEEGAATELAIYNVTPDRGYPAEFGFYEPNLLRAVFLYGRVVGSGAGVHVEVVSSPQSRFSTVENLGASVNFFGDPTVRDQGSGAPVAFFTDPSDCGAAKFSAEVHVDTWQRPGRFLPDGEPDLTDPDWLSASATLPPVTGCGQLQFQPAFSFAPESAHALADEPSGYTTTLRIPQNEDPNGLATPPLKNTVVTLPPGVAIAPAAADGLVGCPEAGPEGFELQSADAGHCPGASNVGSVEIVTPLLKEPLKGSVYVTQPTCGGAGQPGCSEEAAETGGLFSLYVEAGSETSSVYIKLKGNVEVGGNGPHSREAGLAPGQIRTTFAETPQQPFSELRLKFSGGPRATLANPQNCGTFTTAAELESWAHTPAPGEASGTPNVTTTPSFSIGGCEERFAPAFTAGAVNPQAGSYAPFVLTFSRQDREQDLGGVTVHMPPGLIGKVAGIPQCPEAQANAGTCSAASAIGTATSAAGSGAQPLWQSGTVYLTGPYKGAPFGLSVVVPANAGPYHLGNIVVRSAIYIDPHTAALTVVSDPLPQMIDGVPLRLKTVNVTVNREGFMSNPTSCEPTQVGGTITSTQGATAAVSSRFQAANCASLPFKPSFTVATQGRTSKANGASLDVKVSEKPGEANIHKVDVELPLALPARLTTLQKACTEAQFAANPAGCPAASNVGTAIAHTPVLNSPLTGPAYLVSHGGAAFPDLDIVLQGEGVTIILTGNTDIKKGITYSKFETVPDAPISSFELSLPEGPHSALAANANLCAPTKTKTVTKRVTVRSRGRTRHVTRRVKELVPETLQMPTTIVGQNGAQVTQSTKISVTGCARHKAAKKASTRKRHKGKARGKRKR
jgi:hypothetical protein